MAELHGVAFGARRSSEALAAFLTDIFFDHPWRDDSLPSLAYVDREGRLVGCLGSMPRPMMLGERRVRAVVTHNFMVDPAYRGGLAALHLMRAMIANGPDIMIADSNEAGRRICEALGGRTLPDRAGRWARVLRPGALGVHLLGRDRSSVAARALGALVRLPDALAAGTPGSPLRASARAGGAALEPAELAALLERHTSRARLRPVYSEGSIDWMVTMLRKTRREQTLRLRKVEEGGETRGWYVYYSRPEGIGRVLQLGAARGAQRLVLEHLFGDALKEGNVAVSGQADPAWTASLSATSCIFRPGRTWFVVHTSDEELGHALAGPEAFFTRLEGEGWLQFGY